MCWNLTRQKVVNHVKGIIFKVKNNMKLLRTTYHSILNLLKKIKTRYVFNRESEYYLRLTDISEQQLHTVKQKFDIKMICTSEKGYKQDKNFYQNSYFLQLLRIKSFYSNAKLFQFLAGDKSGDNLYFDFRKYKAYKIFNEHIHFINIKELEKNIQYLNNVKINCLVLELALSQDNIKLYNLIESYLDWQKEKNIILESMCFVVTRYGSKIKHSQLSNKIREHVQVDNFYKYNYKNFYHPYLHRQSHTQHIDNINDFFNINLLDIVVHKELSYQEIKILHLNYRQQQQVLKKIPQEKNYTFLLYFLNDNKEISMKKKLYWLNKNELLSKHFWDEISSSYIGTLSIVFQNYHILKKLVDNELLKKLIEKYKEHVSQLCLNFETTMDFIKKYPFVFTKEELSQLIANTFVYCEYRNDLEHEAIELINQKYIGQITAQMGNLINDDIKYKSILDNTNKQLHYLYKKYYQYFKDESFLLSVVKSSNCDILLFCYLNKFFANDNTIELKTKVAQNFYRFTQNIYSSNPMYGKTLTWIIKNDLLNIALDNEPAPNNLFTNEATNYLVPLLIEQYKIKPDYFLEKSVQTDKINKELFYFILNNYKISVNVYNNICKQVYIYNKEDLAQELFKREMFPNEQLSALIKEYPNSAGNILLKSQLKNKLESKYDKIKNKEKVHKI